jgi:lipopolysaccharide/colanic/teichoic acid biosynthesis glycosyltransferase
MQKVQAMDYAGLTGEQRSASPDAILRRALDIFAAGLGLLILSPLFLVIALAIRRDTPGPVFFKGDRVGKAGRKFKILKFRTMYERPASYQGSRITAADDDRITPLGRWLRRTKINELPQLWNVLTGEMSLVGPRPEDPDVAEQWPAPVRAELLSVRPGITSPATIIFRHEEDQLHAGNVLDEYLRSILPNKLRIDTLYIRHRSVFSDLDVILMTLVLLLPQIKRIEIPETSLYWGPIARFVNCSLNWFCADALVALLAIAFSGIVWRFDHALNIGVGMCVALAFVTSLCFSLLNDALGLNKVVWRRAPASDVFSLAVSASITMLFLTIANSFSFQVGRTVIHLPYGMIFLAGFLAWIGFVSLRYRSRILTGIACRWLRKRNGVTVIGERVLIVGAGDNSQYATWLFTRSEYARLFTIVGMVDDDPRKQGMQFDGYEVLGATREIPALVKRLDVGLVIYTITNIDSEARERILAACQQTKAGVVELPNVLADLQMRFHPSGQHRSDMSELAPAD